MAVIPKPISTNDTGALLRTVGGLIVVFSLIGGLLVMFVMPDTYPFVAGLQLLILGFLMIIGAISFLLGNVLIHKKKN